MKWAQSMPIKKVKQELPSNYDLELEAISMGSEDKQSKHIAFVSIYNYQSETDSTLPRIERTIQIRQ